MFYCAEALLLAEAQVFSSHRAVIAAFGQHFAKTKLLPPVMHQWLREAFEKRQISDYDFVVYADDADVVEMISKARQFMANTQNFLKGKGLA